MKKHCVAALLALCLTPSLAAAELELDGSVEASRVYTLLAPYSGVAGDINARAGDEIAQGEALLTLSTTAVYADFDGTVTGVFAQPGDSAASVQERYGALLYMERDALYTASCSTSGAGSDNDNKIVHAGEHVFVRSTEDTDRRGEGVVTGVEGRGYTVEVTDAGTLRVSERVRIYRDADYRSEHCIGTGSLSRIDPTAVTAEGYVLAMYAQAGERVSRGDLLAEMVPDALAGMQGGDGAVYMPEAGVLLEVRTSGGERVEKDAPLLTYCPLGALEAVFTADEDDLQQLSVGDGLTVTLDAYPDEPLRGTVSAISGVGERDGGRTRFDVTVTLEDNDLARVGMSATAEKE